MDRDWGRITGRDCTLQVAFISNPHTTGAWHRQPTHNMQQAARASDQTAFFLMGELVELTETSQLFTSPSDKRTEDYITGKFG